MSNELAVIPAQTGGSAVVPSVGRVEISVMESALLTGDLSKMPAVERMHYYRAVCETQGLNPLTRPFDYLNLSGKLTFYAKKDCTDQLRKIHNVTVRFDDPKVIEGILYIRAYASMPNGRTDESTGAVCIEGLKGEAKANAFMKCETKAKRRVTLSICGLGFMDESEVDSIKGARRVSIDEAHTFDVIPEPPAQPTSTATGGNSQKGEHAPVNTTPASSAAAGGGNKPAAKLPPALQKLLDEANSPVAAFSVIQGMKKDIEELTGSDHGYYAVITTKYKIDHCSVQTIQANSKLVRKIICDLFAYLEKCAQSVQPDPAPTAPPGDRDDWVPEIIAGTAVDAEVVS